MTEATIEFEQLEEAIKALNDSGIVEEKIEYSLEEEGFDLDELLAQFMRVTESIPFEKEKEAPDIVVNLYNEVADKVMTAKAESECEMYGIGWDSKLSECKQCQKDYPDEYKKCKELSQATWKVDVPQEKKETIPKKPVTKRVKPSFSKSSSVGKNKFGRKANSRYGKLDSLLERGSTIDQMSAMLASEFDLSDTAKARGVIKGHMKSACKAEGVEIKELPKGVFKYV